MPQPYVQPQPQLPPPVTPQHQQHRRQQRTSQSHNTTGTTTRQGKKPKFHNKKYHKLPLPERPSLRSSVYSPLSEFGGYAASADTADTADYDARTVNDSGYASGSWRSESSELTLRPSELDDGEAFPQEVALRPSDSCSNWGGPEAPATRVIEPGIPLRPAPHRTGTLPQQRRILHADPSHTYHQQAGRAPRYASSSISAPSAVPTTEYEGDDDRSESESSSTSTQSQTDVDGLDDNEASNLNHPLRGPGTVRHGAHPLQLETALARFVDIGTGPDLGSAPIHQLVEMMEMLFEALKKCYPDIKGDYYSDRVDYCIRRLLVHFFGGLPPSPPAPPGV